MTETEIKAILKSWGAYKRNEAEQAVGCKSLILCQSGSALEVNPDPPPLTLNDEEAERIGRLLASLPYYDSWLIRQVYRDNNPRIIRSRHGRQGLRQAIARFTRIY